MSYIIIFGYFGFLRKYLIYFLIYIPMIRVLKYYHGIMDC